MTIAAILSGKGRTVHSIGCSAPVRDAIAMLADHRIGAVPVMKGEAVVGIMSERDVIYCLKSDGAAIFYWPVERVMTTPAVTATMDFGVMAALSLMTRRRMRHLPVIDEGRLAGIVSIGDLVKYRIEKIEQEAEAMRAYIQSA